MSWRAPLVLALAVGCLGTPQQPTAHAASPPVVEVEEPSPVRAAPGDSVSLRIALHVAPGFHVQANPASDEFLIPLELDFHPAEDDSLLTWQITYPQADTLRLEGSEKDLWTYHDSIQLLVRLHIPADAGPGERLLAGGLRYQACDARRCLFPASVPLSLTLSVEAK